MGLYSFVDGLGEETNNECTDNLMISKVSLWWLTHLSHRKVGLLDQWCSHHD